MNFKMLCAICVTAAAISGCGNNALNQPAPGPTPTAANPNTPAYGQAGGALVPANDPNARVTPVPPGGTGTGYLGATGQPLVPSNNPNAPANSGSTLEEQQKSGYFPNARAPLTPPNSGVR